MAKRRNKGSGALARLSVAQLQQEINRRQQGLGKLLSRRDSLARELAQVEAEINALGGARSPVTVKAAPKAASRTPTGRRRRPKNEMKLAESLIQLLKGKTMSVTEAAQKVQDAGYKTSSSTFRTIVNQTLISNPAFKRVSRGLYTAK